MASASSPKPSRVKVRDHRARLREQGLRPIQIWVPDVRSPAFRSEAHRQSAAVAAGPRSLDDQAFIDAVSAWGDEDRGNEDWGDEDWGDEDWGDEDWGDEDWGDE